MMALNFYIVQHTARLGVAHKYFENMGSWWREDREKKFNENLHNAGIHIHVGMFINENLVFCIYETKDTISDAEFQEFIDGPEALGVHMGLYPEKTCNNTCHKINPSLGGSNPPFDPYFEE